MFPIPCILSLIQRVTLHGLKESRANAEWQRLRRLQEVSEMEFEGVKLRLYMDAAQSSAMLSAAHVRMPVIAPGRENALSEPFISCHGFRAIAIRQTVECSVIELLDSHLPRHKADTILKHFAERLGETLQRSR